MQSQVRTKGTIVDGVNDIGVSSVVLAMCGQTTAYRILSTAYFFNSGTQA